MRDPDPETMRRLGHLAVDLAVDHLAALGGRRVATPPDPAELRALVDEPLPRAGLGVERSLARFFDELLPRATHVGHPRFFAYVPGPGSFVGALGEWVAAATNLFVGSWLGGAAMAQLEVCVLGWVREALGLPAGWGGVLTSGGSMANLSALAAARARCADPGAARIYVSREAHYSLAKAARILGFGHDAAVEIGVDDRLRLDPGALRAAVERDRAAGRRPLAVCATAGTTSTGAFDPLAECALLCRELGLWLHVDGAYGAALAVLPENDALSTALAAADSITLDPHKWLFAPFESGCLLVRDVGALHAAFGADGDYLQDIPRDEVNFFERGPELSRGNRALKLWLLWRAVGLDAIAAAIRRNVAQCRLARELLAADPRVEIVTEPSTSVFTFAVAGGEPAGRALFERILRDGFLMLSTSRVGGRFVLRFCVVSHRTTDDDVRAAVARIRALLDQPNTES